MKPSAEHTHTGSETGRLTGDLTGVKTGHDLQLSVARGDWRSHCPPCQRDCSEHNQHIHSHAVSCVASMLHSIANSAFDHPFQDCGCRSRCLAYHRSLPCCTAASESCEYESSPPDLLALPSYACLQEARLTERMMAAALRIRAVYHGYAQHQAAQGG